MMPGRHACFFFVVLVAVGVPARAQQRGSDVGGQPAKRKVTKMPRLTKFIEADYPPAKKAAGAAASVILTIEIDARGKVVSVAVASGVDADFDRAAVAAAERFEFEPAEVDDKPAPSKITYRYDFVISSPEPAPPPSPSETPRVALEKEPTPQPAVPPRTKEPADIEEVQVRGRPRSRRETLEYSVRAEQGKKVAGTQGDVLKVVQNLPGVSRPPVASGQIVVWGSAPNDTRIYVDGVDLPALYHGSGLRGTLNSDLVASIDLVPGAFGAEYGRGLGGLVRVETRTLPQGTHGYVGADTLDGSAFASTSVTDRIRVGGAFRYGWLDRVLAAASAPDIGDFFPIPRYRDAQIKASIDLREKETLDAVFLASSDELDRTVLSADPAGRRVEQMRSGFWRAYARYTRADERSTTIVTPFVGHDAKSLAQRFGSTPAQLDVQSDRYGLRGLIRTRLGKSVSFFTGLDALGSLSTVSREGSLTLPAREGDVAVFGQPPGDEYALDTWKVHVLDVGPHAYADVRIGPVTITPGVRFDAFLIEGTKKLPASGNVPPIGFARLETALAPRASARWTVTPRFALTTAYGQYHQAPEPEDLSAVFGTPELGLARATHMMVGESLRVTDSTTVDVALFHKQMKDLVVRSRLSNPLRARALTQNGEGQSYGVQFLVRQELWRGFFGWASYAISRSERRYEGDERWRPFDFDQPHVLSLVASQEIGAFTVGARFRYASGNPRTPVLGGVYDSRSDRWDPVFGAQNTTRVPSFWQLDCRIERAFALGDSTRLLVFADLQNITGRKNAEEIVYSANFGRRGEMTGLPFVAVVGARLER